VFDSVAKIFEEVVMNKTLVGAALLTLPIIAGGLAYASSQKPANEQAWQIAQESFICPVSGEELPCEKCCQLNGK
jgi:hypothetical protein